MLVKKFCGKLIYSLSFLFLSTGALKATPYDLQQILNSWNETLKMDESSSLVHVEAVSFDKDPSQLGKMVLEDELSNEKISSLMNISNIELQTLKDESRESILKNIFPSKKIYLEFCKAFPLNPYKSKEDSSMSEEEERDAANKYSYSQCKRVTQSFLGGVLYANPLTYLMNTSGVTEDLESRNYVTFYIVSFIDPAQGLKFSFKL